MKPISVCHGGYTLIEMIAVMLIISIMTATVAIRMSSASERAVINQADQLRRDIAHVQALALSWGVRLRLSIASDGTGYSVNCLVIVANTPCTSLVTSPIDPATGQSFSVTLTDEVLIAPASNTVDFDSLGRPVSGGIPLSASPVRTYTLSSPGKSVKVTVQPITGFAATS